MDEGEQDCEAVMTDEERPLATRQAVGCACRVQEEGSSGKTVKEHLRVMELVMIQEGGNGLEEIGGKETVWWMEEGSKETRAEY
ncbi:hypothetical protein O3P69_006236 [Scylla paramamosain]|uniref:Uncharacterized protein n=1 Tax=Scylla paramamosain TaxID=85552 RepID=A0AAW0U5Z7_SCYPA